MKQIIQAQSLSFVINAEKTNSGAEFTVLSKATGKDFTFKINRSEFNGRFYTHVKVEQQYQEYRYLGTYFAGAIRRKRELVESASAKAIAWILKKVEEQKFELLNEKVEIMHTGSCLRCGRTLTDHESIEIGLGPICRSL